MPRRLANRRNLSAIAWAFFLSSGACTSPSGTATDAARPDAGLGQIEDVQSFPDAVSRPDAVGGLDVESFPDATMPDGGVTRFPQRITLRSEGANTYRDPVAITTDPTDSDTLYFSALTSSGEAAIFELKGQGPLKIIYQGSPLVMPVDLEMNANGRLLYIADLAADNSGKVFTLDIRLRSIEELTVLDDFSEPSGLARDPDTPSILLTGRFPGTELGSVWELRPADVSPAPIPLAPAIVMNDPSHIVWVRSQQTMYVYDAHSTSTQLGRVYRISLAGDFSIVGDHLASNYPAGIEMALDESYLLISTSTPSVSGGDTIHVIDLLESPPSRYPLRLGQKIIQPRDIHRIGNSNRWLVIDSQGGSAGNGAIYQLE